MKKNRNNWGQKIYLRNKFNKNFQKSPKTSHNLSANCSRFHLNRLLKPKTAKITFSRFFYIP